MIAYQHRNYSSGAAHQRRNESVSGASGSLFNLFDSDAYYELIPNRIIGFL